MCVACALVGGNANRIAKLNRSGDCLGCEEMVACLLCGKQACYQRLGGSCANQGAFDDLPLCLRHRNGLFHQDIINIAMSL